MIGKIEKKDENVVEDDQQIEEEVVRLFKNLYSNIDGLRRQLQGLD